MDLHDGDVVRVANARTLQAHAQVFLVEQIQDGAKTFHLSCRKEPSTLLQLDSKLEPEWEFWKNGDLLKASSGPTSVLYIDHAGFEGAVVRSVGDPTLQLGVRGHEGKQCFSATSDEASVVVFIPVGQAANADKPRGESLLPDPAAKDPAAKVNRASSAVALPPAARATAAKPPTGEFAFGPAHDLICLHETWKSSSKLGRYKALLQQHERPMVNGKEIGDAEWTLE